MNKNNNKTVKVRTTKINEVRQQQESAYEKQLMLFKDKVGSAWDYKDLFWISIISFHIMIGFEEIENIVMNLSTNTIIG
ncbi:15657_t:CDS:2 [Entrophospora sp. SA101]|nr:15657_t:CDS:2 [Entrophospora sp. SA101]